MRHERLHPPDGWPVPSDDLTFETFLADASAVLDHLGDRADIGPIAVLGHSKGGTLAVHMADRRDVLATVLLVATPNTSLLVRLRTQAETLAGLVTGTGDRAGANDAVASLQELADDVTAIVDGASDGPPVGRASRAY